MRQIITSDLERHLRALRAGKSLPVQGPPIPQSGPGNGYMPPPPFPGAATVSMGMTQGAPLVKLGASTNVTYGQPMFFSPIHTPINWQIPSKRKETYTWLRFFYLSEPKVAAAIDFYSMFPINKFTNELADRKKKHEFDRLCERLQLVKWLRIVSHEAHLLGDCFPFVEIECPHCHSTGMGDDGKPCLHEGGGFKRIVVLNPEYVELYSSPLMPEPVIALLPDEELRKVVTSRGLGYERMTNQARKMIQANMPIPLDNRNVSHIKFAECGYARFGTSIVRRLFPILAYKTKLMTAQWIVAERMILPIKVVKIGSAERPASYVDIANMQTQIASTANDPNLTLVTGHDFEVDWFGACHDEETEVLTENGWKHYHEVVDGEKICTFNKETGKLEYQVPQAKQIYPYDGEMVHISGRHLDTCVTPNHMMLASPRAWDNEEERYTHGPWTKIRADEVVENTRFLDTCDWDGEDQDLISTNLGHLTLDQYLELAGYYLSEGGVKSWRGSADGIHLTQHPSSPYHDRMFEVLALAGKCSHSICTNNCHQATVNSRSLASEMIACFGHYSENKFIPHWIKQLPKQKLRILLRAMMAGDGSERFSDNGNPRWRYRTCSKALADDVQEILLKLGVFASISLEPSENPNHSDMYSVNWCLGNTGGYVTVKDRNIKRVKYTGEVWCFTVPNGFFVTRRNGKVAIHGNSGKVLALGPEFELIAQEILDGLMINKSLLNGEGPQFANASIGIEAMIQRLEQWRSELAEWVEQHIYLPYAMMRNFVEKNEWGEEEYVYPRIKWDRMALRDQQNYRQFMLQLHEKGNISTQTLLEAFDINYDAEIEKIRFERISNASQGGGAGAGMAAPGPGGMGGGFSGMPGGDMGGGGGMPPIGPDMGGGMPGAPGGAPGDMGGGMGPAPGGPGGGPGMTADTRNEIIITSQTAPAVAPANPPAQSPGFDGKVLTEKTRNKIERERQRNQRQQERSQKDAEETPGALRDQRGRIMMTRIERELFKNLIQAREQGRIRHPIHPQCDVWYGKQLYSIDLAFPDILLGIEADGETFHKYPDQKERDKQRDANLAKLGWTILRFTDEEIEAKMRQILETIEINVAKKEKELQQRKD